MSKVVFEFDDAIITNIEKTFKDKSFVEIGIVDGKSNKAAFLGGIHEFGARVPVTQKMRAWFAWWFGVSLRKDKTHITIPSRSFLRKTVVRKHMDFTQYLTANSERFLSDMLYGRWRDALDDFGMKWVDYIKECFHTRGFGTWPKLSRLTVMDKGHDFPLVRSGRLAGSIDHKVINK